MGTINRTTSDLNKILYPAHVHLNLSQAEPIIGDNTWRSPELYVQGIDTPENFNYIGGSLVYTGTEEIEIILFSTISMKSSTAGVTIQMTGGVDGSPALDYVVEHKLTTANDIKTLSGDIVLNIKNGDSIDFFVKSTANISLEYAVWLVKNNTH